jgi:hypothetical protein
MTKEMTEEELVQLLKEGREKGYYIRGSLPDDPAELKQVAREMLKNMVYKEHAEDEMGIGAGGQELVLRRHPSGAWNESTDRALGIYLGGHEWSALFRQVLSCPEGPPFKPGDILDEWKTKHQAEFQESIPDYPMLGRIWDTYIDVVYQPEEIKQLREECLRVQASTLNENALAGLAKLVQACDEASKLGSGLLLLSD